ncbi:MAG TPA: superoxide dismutase family protein [Acidobacteriaceae bacterium]|nr:superoxide dismutase family protein [Acidobacteriaceae bacterium]
MQASLSGAFRAASCGLLAWAALGAHAQDAKPVKEIKVKLTTSKGEPAGTAVFKQKKSGVEVKVSLENIPFGDHGVHIHQNAVCEAPDFKSAGGHFNPDGKQHGFQNEMGHHAGDTPSNVSVGENHQGSATWLLTAVTLQPGAPNSLLSNGGTSLIVHEHGDDMKTDPSGNSGNRIACGVIKQ